MCLAYMLPWQHEPSLWHKEYEEIGLAASDLPLDLFAYIIAGGLVEAHNAFFERAIWENVCTARMGWPGVAPKQWRCSASRASMCALPRDLEGAVRALGLSVEKDMDGNRVMRKMSKPRKLLKAEKEEYRAQGLDPEELIVWHVTAEDVEKLHAYCIKDVLAEHLLSRAMPQLPTDELTLWKIDQELNVRGVLIDLELCRCALELAERIRAEMNAELSDLTDGVVERASQRERVKDYISEHFELDLPDTTADTLDHYMDKVEMPEECFRIIQIVREVNKTSTSKYGKMIINAARDGRAHDILMYHGAGTGRWAGKGIQVQNLPKGDLWDIDLAVEDIKSMDLDTIRMWWGEPMEALAGALRGALMPSSGRDFMVADYSAIEARCVLWLADAREALEVFYTGGDIYCDMATTIYGYQVNKKTHKKERQFGKQAILGLGYGMGYLKFFLTCRGYKIQFSKEDVLRIMGQAKYAQYLKKIKRSLCLVRGETYTKKDMAAARKTIRQLTEAREDYASVLHELALMKYTVDLYRSRYGAVKKMWKEQEQAAIRAVLEKRTKDNPYVCGKVKWYLSDQIEIDMWDTVPFGKWLLCELPSGRTLFYADPSVKPTKTSWGETRNALRYMSVDSQTKKWTRTATYGGKIVENITQAVARDVMAHAMIQCADEGVYDLVMTVHDEMVTEVDHDVGRELVQVGEKNGKPVFREEGLIDFERLMGDKPEWAKGCPITAEAERMPRYRK
ncbi:MAG: DNA polymerase [Cyanobacteria bacterium J06638_20]